MTKPTNERPENSVFGILLALSLVGFLIFRLNVAKEMQDKYKTKYKYTEGTVIDVVEYKPSYSPWSIKAMFKVNGKIYWAYAYPSRLLKEKELGWIGHKFQVKYLEDDPQSYHELCLDKHIPDSIKAW